MTIPPYAQQSDSLPKEKLSVFLQKTGIFFTAFLIGFLSFKELRSINDIIFVLLLAVFIANTIISYRKNHSFPGFTHKPLDIFILLSFLWALVTLFQALDPSYSFAEIMHKMTKQYLLYFLTFYIVSDYVHNKGEMKNIFVLLGIATCMMSLYAIWQFLQSPVILKTRVTGFTQAFYRLSVFLVLTIPIMAVLFISQKGWMKKILFCIALASCIALVFTFTRAAWIAVIVEVILLVSFLYRKYLRKIFLVLFVLLLIGSIIAVTSGDYQKLIIHGSEQPRIAAFHYSMEIIKNNFFMGIGYGKKSFLLNFQNNVEVQHTHNIFLNTAIETGIPGLALFVIILFLIIRIFLYALKADPSYEKKVFIAGIFAAIIGFLTLNLFDYMYIGWPGQMFWMLVGTGHAFIKSELSG
jgi:O-antigen ligase